MISEVEHLHNLRNLRNLCSQLRLWTCCWTWVTSVLHLHLLSQRQPRSRFWDPCR